MVRATLRMRVKDGAGGEAEPVGDQFQHPVAGGVQFAVLPEVAGGHLGGVGRHSFLIHVPLEKQPLPRYPTHPVTVGDHIRKRRMDRGLLQREVAEIIGVTESSVWNWEHGTEPELHYNPKIIEFLGYIPFDCPDDTVGRFSWCKKAQVLIDVR